MVSKYLCRFHIEDEILETLPPGGSSSQNQDDHQERFTQLKTRQREAIAAYQATTAEIERRAGIKAKLTRFKKTIQNATLSQDFDRATLHALCQRIQITPSGEANVIFADGTKLPLQY